MKPIGTIPVTGTYTLHSQGNKVWSVIKSLRWNQKLQGWTNNLGLPNPGVKVGLHKHIREKYFPLQRLRETTFRKLYNIIPEGMRCRTKLVLPEYQKFAVGLNRNICQNKGEKKMVHLQGVAYSHTRGLRVPHYKIRVHSDTRFEHSADSELRWVERTNLDPLYV